MCSSGSWERSIIDAEVRLDVLEGKVIPFPIAATGTECNGRTRGPRGFSLHYSLQAANPV